jgi:hypothetical protein
MDDCPDVVSTGRLCHKDGWRHVWEPFEATPTLTRGSRTITYSASNYVPQISGFIDGIKDDEWSTVCAEATTR